MRLPTTVCLLLAFLASESLAGTAVLETPTDPRAIAMGDAGVALGSGVLMSDGNPALLGLAGSSQVELLAPVTKGWHEDSQLWEVGVLSPARTERFYAPAGGIVYREYDWAVPFRSAFEPENSGVITTRTKLMSFVLGAPLPGGVALGAAVRRADIGGVTGWYVDVGGVLQREVFVGEAATLTASLGIAGRRLGNDIDKQFLSSFGKRDVFAIVNRVAANVNPEMAWGVALGMTTSKLHLTAAFQLVDPMRRGTSGEVYEHAGLEIAYQRWAALRVGIVNDEDFSEEITYGGGIRVPFASRWAIGADYAREPALPVGILDDTNAPDASHFVSLRVEYES